MCSEIINETLNNVINLIDIEKRIDLIKINLIS